jgi:hypothetical protein
LSTATVLPVRKHFACVGDSNNNNQVDGDINTSIMYHYQLCLALDWALTYYALPGATIQTVDFRNPSALRAADIMYFQGGINNYLFDGDSGAIYKAACLSRYAQYRALWPNAEIWFSGIPRCGNPPVAAIDVFRAKGAEAVVAMRDRKARIVVNKNWNTNDHLNPADHLHFNSAGHLAQASGLASMITNLKGYGSGIDFKII